MTANARKPTYDVYVGNLPSTADEDSVKRLFGSYGNIHSVLLKDGKQTGTKFGFVRFVAEESCQKAVSDASGKYEKGKVLVVKKAERNPNNPNSSRFSGSGSGGGGGESRGGDSRGSGGNASSGDAGSSARTRGIRQENGSAPQVPQQNLSVVAEETVMLTHAANACCMYVQIGKETAIRESGKLMTDMQAFGQDAPKLTANPEPNVLYGAQFSEDKMWYRCKVLSLGQNQKEAHVRYIDYGNDEITDSSQMVKLTGELSTIKPQAIRLHMHGLKPMCTQKTNAEEHKRAVNFLMGVADNKLLTAKLYKPLPETGTDSTPVELHCESQNLNRLMRDHGFASPVTPAASPNRVPEQQTASQNGLGGHQQAPRQQKPMGGQQQNRQEDGAGRNQGTNKPQNRAPPNRNDAQLESANREVKLLKGDISKLDKHLIALKTENAGLQSILSSAVQEKIVKLQKSFERVRTVRNDMPLDVAADGVIETAINLLGDTDNSITKKVLDAQEVMGANDKLEECQQALRQCTDKELLPDLMVARNEARQETFQSITEFLNMTKALPLLDRQEKVKIALECLEGKYFDLLANKDTTATEEMNTKLLEECIGEYTEWKTESYSYLSGIRDSTDQRNLQWTSLLAKLLLSFTFDRDEVETVELTDDLIDKLMFVMEKELCLSQKIYTPVVKLDPTLLTTKQQRENIKTQVLTKTVCCLTKELRRELASIETLTDLYNHHEKLGKELEPWMNSKPDVSEMQAVQRDIKGLRSRLRHKLADKHDMDEAPELCGEKSKESLNDELRKIRSELQAAYATEDRLLVDLAALTKRHFPELALLHRTFRIEDYIETNGLLKEGRDLQQFDLQPLTGAKSSIVKHGQFNGQNVVIKSYNVSSEENRKTLLHNAIAYSKLGVDRLLHIHAIIPTSELANQLHFQLPRLPMNLATAVKESALTAVQLQTIFLDIVSGLHALHAVDVIHGAIHPENILITEDRHAMLADYDFSKTPTERASQGSKTENGLNLTAPEINCGLDAHIASDMFAFGVLLLWAHYHETVFTTQPDGTPDVSSISMRPELEEIVKHLVNYSQGKRPHSDAVIKSTYFTMIIEQEEEECVEEETDVKEEETKVEENGGEEEHEEEEEQKESEGEETNEEVKEDEEVKEETEEEAPADEDEGPPALEESADEATGNSPKKKTEGEEVIKKEEQSPSSVENNNSEVTQGYRSSSTSPIGRIQNMVANRMKHNSPEPKTCYRSSSTSPIGRIQNMVANRMKHNSPEPKTCRLANCL